ncbi:hypothetical protein AQUCO_09900003v1 [Aquilegia coerulea]|uniref:Uncharacterized protein n=1 Tax=Aquilegia coerulea TaxID=218851 RepID=A0A2G5C4E3_AQUCA|nr:hypothetical protein AQUCO_09900003v1 [Aquilegia coerulea]
MESGLIKQAYPQYQDPVCFLDFPLLVWPILIIKGNERQTHQFDCYNAMLSTTKFDIDKTKPQAYQIKSFPKQEE